MKRIILAITIGLFTVSSFAQKQQNRHEVSVWGGGGISSLQYDLSVGTHKVGTGGIVGLGYNYFFNYNWSLGIGAEFSALGAKAQLYGMTDNYLYPLEEALGNRLLRITTEANRGDNLYERQRAYYVNIPVMARFQFDLFKGHKFYAALGPKFGIPVDGIYRTKGNVTISGHELSLDGTEQTRDPYTDMPNHGFGPKGVYSKGCLDMKMINFIVAAEAGIKWRFKENKHWNMYTGLFVDWGVSDVLNGNSKFGPDLFTNLFEYDGANGRIQAPNTVLTSSYNGKPFADRVNSLAFGAKVAVSYGWKPFDKKERVKEIAPEKPFEGLTAAQMEDIMGRNTQALIDAQQKEFDDLKKMLAEQEPYFLGPINNFDLNKSIILASMTSELDRKAAVMKKFPQIKVTLEGHTDDQGGDQLNDQLGLDRANAVKEYMVRRGIAASRMEVATKGKREPIIPNASEENRRFNRRVEFILRK